MSEDLCALLEEEAARQGISAANVVRDALLLRLGQLSAARGDSGTVMTIEELANRSLAERRLYERDDDRGPLHDPERLMAIERTGLVDAPADRGLETLTNLCATLLGLPMALVSIVEADRQFFAAACGLAQPWADERQVRLSHSFCQHAVVSRQPFVVSDAREHPLVRDNMAIRDLGVIAYAGIPLLSESGDVLGTFCAIDHKPRQWTKSDLATLNHFAASAMAYIQRRQSA